MPLSPHTLTKGYTVHEAILAERKLYASQEYNTHLYTEYIYCSVRGWKNFLYTVSWATTSNNILATCKQILSRIRQNRTRLISLFFAVSLCPEEDWVCGGGQKQKNRWKEREIRECVDVCQRRSDGERRRYIETLLLYSVNIIWLWLSTFIRGASSIIASSHCRRLSKRAKKIIYTSFMLHLVR